MGEFASAFEPLDAWPVGVDDDGLDVCAMLATLPASAGGRCGVDLRDEAEDVFVRLNERRGPGARRGWSAKALFQNANPSAKDLQPRTARAQPSSHEWSLRKPAHLTMVSSCYKTGAAFGRAFISLPHLPPPRAALMDSAHHCATFLGPSAAESASSRGRAVQQSGCASSPRT